MAGKAPSFSIRCQAYPSAQASPNLLFPKWLLPITMLAWMLSTLPGVKFLPFFYSRKSIRIWQEKWGSMVFGPRPLPPTPLPAQPGRNSTLNSAAKNSGSLLLIPIRVFFPGGAGHWHFSPCAAQCLLMGKKNYGGCGTTESPRTPNVHPPPHL